MNIFTSKLGIMIAVITLAVFGYFTWSVLGGTRLALTLTTNPDLENGLVGHWTFDGPDMIDNVTDRSGQGNDGYLTNFNSTTTVSGKLGQALDFDGVNDYVDVGDGSVLDAFTEFTISAWINIDDYGSDDAHGKSGIIADKYWDGSTRTWFFAYDSSGLLATRIATDDLEAPSSTVKSNNSVSLNTWTQVVLRYNGINIDFYIDGQGAGGGGALTGTVLTNSEVLKIGAYDIEGTPVYSDGSIDDVRIYNRVLSADEITRLYHLGATTHINKTLTTSETLQNGLVGHWTFDGKDMIDNATDRSGQGNHGDLTNFNSTTTVSGKLGQALEFDGVNDYVDVGDDLYESNNTGTISMWLNIDTVGGETYAFSSSVESSSSNHIAVRLQGSTPVLQFYSDGRNDFVYGQGLGYNKWAHLTITSNGSLYTFYKNGAKVSPTVSAGSNLGTWFDDLASAAHNTVIGRRKRNPDTLYFNGAIDDVRIYNRALSADEISRLYHLGATTHINKTLTSNSDLENGLVGHWTFDGPDMIGNATDRSGQGNDGYLTNFTSTTTVSGKLGQALEFDGVDDYVDVGSAWTPLNTGEPFTISAWTYLHDFDNQYPVLMQFRSNSGVVATHFSNSASYLGMIIGSEDAGWGQYKESSTDLLNRWVHVVYTYNGQGATTIGNFAIYKDGVSRTLSTAGAFGASANVNYIGNRDSGLYWDGAIDDVRIYNRALSAEEVQRLYEMGR